jgi:hypothetical protein
LLGFTDPARVIARRYCAGFSSISTNRIVLRRLKRSRA